MAKAIQVENLSKQYRLGQIGTGSLKHDLNRWWHSVRGKENPYLQIGEANDRTTKGDSEYVWSLRDVNFDIEQGDSIGIIGRNGAGKSTLLKILSRVTAPTTGSVKVKGRIASLLEVGTGFHPDLSGRDNIYLNGAILGMRKAEITRKFDEIVDFAGVERYIDTPVKRYSSGMYVRLAFAVAAHLESEILIVDEVLAVGDAEFQKKCLGKMGDVSKGEGRTVLFVSHNMGAVQALCQKGVLLSKGSVESVGNITSVIKSYQTIYQNSLTNFFCWDNNNQPGNEVVRLLSVGVYSIDGEKISDVDITQPFALKMQYQVFEDGHILWQSFNLNNSSEVNIFDTHSTTSEYYNREHPKGIFESCVEIPGNFLNEGEINIGCAIFNHSRRVIHLIVRDVVKVNVIDKIFYKNTTARGSTTEPFVGMVRPLLQWKTLNTDQCANTF